MNNIIQMIEKDKEMKMNFLKLDPITRINVLITMESIEKYLERAKK